MGFGRIARGRSFVYHADTAVDSVGSTCGSQGGMVSWPRRWHTPCRAWYWCQATRSLILCFVFSDPVILRAVGQDAVAALVKARFMLSPKSVLEPVAMVSFLGSCLNLTFRTVSSHPHAL